MFGLLSHPIQSMYNILCCVRLTVVRIQRVILRVIQSYRRKSVCLYQRDCVSPVAAGVAGSVRCQVTSITSLEELFSSCTASIGSHYM